jgi:hypothetical protein
VDLKSMLNRVSDMANTVIATVFGYVEALVGFFRPFNEDTTPKQAVVKGAVKVACGLATLATVCLAPSETVVITIVMLGLAALAGVQMYLGACGMFELIMGTIGTLRSAP